MNLKFINVPFFILFFFVSFNLNAQSKDSLLRINNAFKAGEQLKYKVRYGLIKGGEASMKIDLVPSGDTWVYRVRALAQTTGVVGSLVTIRDIYESFVDIQTGYPVKSVRNIREHNYTKYNEVLFFRDKGYLTSLKSGKHNAPDNILDILSAFYFARMYLFNNQMNKNDKIVLKTFFDDAFFDINIKYKRIEKIKTKFGKIDCMLFVPATSLNGTFKKEEQLKIWVSDDKNFIPVKIRVKLPIGSLKCDLIDFDGLKNDNFQLRKKKSKLAHRVFL